MTHGGRKFSGTLFWYMLRQFVVPLCCCVVAFCVLFLISDIFDDLEDFLDARTQLSRVVLYFLYRQPVNMVHVLPMSVLLSVSYTMCNLARHFEITAIRAAGISIVRCCLPVWILSVLLCGGLFWLNESAGPAFAGISERLLDVSKHGRNTKASEGQPLGYRNTRAGRDWFFESFRQDGEQRGVSVKQFSADGSQLVWELRARRAAYEGGVWVFADGERAAYRPGESMPEQTEPFERLTLPELKENPAAIFNRMQPLEELSAFQMVKILKQNPDLPRSTYRLFATTVWYRFSYPLSCLIAALFGVGMTLGRQRASALRGFAFAVALMAMYYVVSQLFVLMGKYGALPPSLAGAVPTLAFVVFGGWRVYQKR